uniref:Aminopeptidase n=1 Tax=Heliothis virescens TaxID=7102 RepID=A0A2A4JS21_HELVI
MRWLHTLAAAAVLHAACSAEYLLPGNVAPVHYDLKYAFDIEPSNNFSFYGVVDILLNVKKPTSKIVLHAKDFSVSEDGIAVTGLQTHKVMGTKINDTYNLMTITLDGQLVANENYTLTIPFYGNLKPGLDGVYISTYVNKQTNVKEYLIATQFEAISARKGFPCFDEPMYKATFTITIGHHKDFTAISNMPLENASEENAIEDFWAWTQIETTFKKPKSDFLWDTFEKSVPMSTYLVAFVVSKFSYVQSPADLSTTKFRIWARNDAMDQTAYASITGPKALTYFEEWFNVSYPLPKQDMIAIPDFAAGAMENWGLITYRETELLYDEKQSSFLNKERVAEVIAHELAHQWFGNIVTMKWWSDLWLNEGFATFAASVAVNHVEPTWTADKSYAADNMLSVLNLDALESSHPVSVPIDDPKRISEIFDEISYRKGSTLIRMMTMFLGNEIFRKAINNYLRKYSYNNAAQDDLWRELTAVSDEYGVLPRNVSVKDIMDTWTTQTGYPILTVNRDYEDKSLTVKQRRYFSLAAKSPNMVSWWVPLSVLCEPETRGSPPPGLQWLGAGQGGDTLQRYTHSSERDQWVLFNYDMIAPYRVNYDSRNWQLLTAALKSSDYSRVPLMGRVQLLSDAFALAWTNHLDYSTALNLASYLQREKEYLPLSTGLKALSKIENVLKRTPDYGAFQKFVRKLIGETYERAGGLATKKILNGKDLNSVKMQVTTSAWACRMKVPGCEENAMQLFQQWMDTENPDENNPIPLDLRRTVYCVGVSRGSVVQWRFALAREQRANVAAARDALLQALTCTREVWILAHVVQWRFALAREQRANVAAARDALLQALTCTREVWILAHGASPSRGSSAPTWPPRATRCCRRSPAPGRSGYWRSTYSSSICSTPLDLRRTVYCVGVSRGSVVQWRFALAREQRANVAAARDALLQALTCTREVWILAHGASPSRGSSAPTWPPRATRCCRRSPAPGRSGYWRSTYSSSICSTPLDLRRTVYCVGVSRGSVVQWRFALAREQRANVAAARDALLQALTCTREVWILAHGASPSRGSSAPTWPPRATRCCRRSPAPGRSGYWRSTYSSSICSTPLDLRRTVYCVGVSRGSVVQWRFALAREQRANVAAARDALLQALTCTREVWILAHGASPSRGSSAPTWPPRATRCCRRSPAPGRSGYWRSTYSSSICSTPLDLRRTVYCVGVSRGSVVQWRFALAREQRANVAAARDALLQALTCTREVWILAQYLEWTITEGSEVRRQDAGAVIANIMRSPVGYYVAKDFVYERIEDIYNAFKGQARRIGHIIKILLDQFTSQSELDNFLSWREKNAKFLAESKLSVEQAIEKARVNINWITKNRRAVIDKLREFSTQNCISTKDRALGLTHSSAAPAARAAHVAVIAIASLYIV